jgi:hypothetical protein
VKTLEWISGACSSDILRHEVLLKFLFIYVFLLCSLVR